MARLWIRLVTTALAAIAPLACSKTCVDDGLHGKQSGAACQAATTTAAETTTSTSATTAVTTSSASDTSDTTAVSDTAATDCSCGSTGELLSTSNSVDESTSEPASSTGVDLCQNGDIDPDNGETDLNCGGPNCQPCVGPLMCQVDSDCASNLCPAGFCSLPECFNDVFDPGIEFYLDCGGQCGPTCPLGAPCQFSSDCAGAGQCFDGTCALDPTCTNHGPDPGETATDCGGPTCGQSCKHMQGCVDDSDCISGTCSGGCFILHCVNQSFDPDLGELDADCGGECGLCAPGWACIYDSDCDDSSCIDNICV